MMRRLSSKWTRFYKWVLPVALAVAMVAFCLSLWFGREPSTPLWSVVVAPLVTTLLLVVVYFAAVRNLVDEVWLDDDALKLVRRDVTVRVPLGAVAKVDELRAMNPSRIALVLNRDTPFGRRVTFLPASPRGFLAAFKPDPIAAELRQRVAAVGEAKR